MSFRIFGRLLRQGARRFGAKLYSQGLHDLLGHVALKVENVLYVTVIILRPEMITVAHIDQLSGDAQLIADFTKDVLFVFALERKTRCSSWHAQSRHLGQHIDQFLGHPVTQILVVFIRAHVHEWQHGNRFVRRDCSRLALSRRGCRSLEHQLIHEQTGRDDRQRDRNGYNPSTGASLDRFTRLDLGFEFDSFRRDLKRPRKNQRHRKTEDDDDDKYLHHPRRRVEGREENRRRLNQQPRHHRVRDRDFVNIAPLHFGEETLEVHFFELAAFPFGASDSTICSKRGSPRSGSQKGRSFKAP